MAELALQQPGNGGCTFCANTPTTRGTVDPMVVGVGMDVNWGEPLQVCKNCSSVIADLIGRVSEMDLKKTERAKEKAVQERDLMLVERDDLQDQLNTAEARIRRMLDGVKARKEAKEAANG